MSQVIPTKTIKDNGTIAIRNGIKPNKNKEYYLQGNRIGLGSTIPLHLNSKKLKVLLKKIT